MSDRHEQLHEMLLRGSGRVETHADRRDATARFWTRRPAKTARMLRSARRARRMRSQPHASQRALDRRICQAKLPKLKTLADYDSSSPNAFPSKRS